MQNTLVDGHEIFKNMQKQADRAPHKCQNILAMALKYVLPTWISLYDNNKFIIISAVKSAGSPSNNFIRSNS